MGRENKRNWYLQIPFSFFDDPDYKRFKRRLPKEVKDGTAIYMKMILQALKENETDSGEDVTLSFYHDEDSFPEEIAYTINEDPEEVRAVVDTMLDCGILEEIEPETWQIHFPDGTVGSITDSSLRSRKSREKRKALHCNTDATPVQCKATQSNIYNNNINNNINKNINNNLNNDCVARIEEERPADDPLIDSNLSEPVKDKLRQWLQYKRERRESYKPTGLNALIDQVYEQEQKNGSTAVINAIDWSMSQNYKGIVWDKAANPNSGIDRFDAWGKIFDDSFMNFGQGDDNEL